MTPDLALTGSIPNLLRRGSPVNVLFDTTNVAGVYLGPDDAPEDKRNGPHIVAPVDVWPEDFGGSCAMARSCKSEELTLDLTDPTGRFHALLWLKERGHDLAWAMEEPGVLAWSVLSVAGGNFPITDILAPWDAFGAGCSKRTSTRDSNVVLRVTGPTSHAWRVGWECLRRPVQIEGDGFGPAGQHAADNYARSKNMALRNADGTLTLPELPAAGTDT